MSQRDYILDATLKEIATHGYHRTAMERGADEAGLGKTALYTYFKNKQGLFKALMEREGSQGLSDLKSVMESEKNPWHKLKAYCLERFRIMTDTKGLLEVSEQMVFVLQ